MSCLCLYLPNDLFPSGFLTTVLYKFLISYVHTACPTHFIHYFITLINLLKNTNFECPHQFSSAFYSCLLGPYNLSRSLFLISLNSCSSKIRETKFYTCIVLLTAAWNSSGCGWWRLPSGMEGSCKYTHWISGHRRPTRRVSACMGLCVGL
jgi:hypothetical protein